MQRNKLVRCAMGPTLQPLEARTLLSADSTGLATASAQQFGGAPAVFVENQGQWADSSIRYVFQGSGANVLMADSGPVFQLFRRIQTDPQDSVTQAKQFSVQFDGAIAGTPVGLEPSQTLFNYFLGDQSTWRSRVPGYQAVAYPQLYPGIELQTFGQRDSLKYEFHVAPGADYTQIQVSYQGIAGLSLDDSGQLHLAPGDGWEELVDDAPVIYQQIGGQRVEVAGQFELVDADTYSFRITGDYDPARELVIDPDLAWATDVGGISGDYGTDVAVDDSGNILLTGQTSFYGSGWASGGFDTSHNGGQDAFVAKLSSSGDLLWATYLGGAANDYGSGIAVADSGDVVVTGYTQSSDWVSGGFDTSFGGGKDAFVAKLSPSGDFLWSTYLGGAGDDNGNNVVLDDAGNIIVVGNTHSPGWTGGGFDTSYVGGDWADGFAVKLSPSGAHIWSTYMGRSRGATASAVVLDGAGDILIAGSTVSEIWPGFPSDFYVNDGFLLKLSPSGSYRWSTQFGGTGGDEFPYAIGVDGSGNILVAGSTGSVGWLSGGFDTSFNGLVDAFVVKLSSTGTQIWGTYLGGTWWDDAWDMAVDGCGNVLVVGSTDSTGWTSGGFDTSFNGGQDDAFVVKLNSSGQHIWSTYMGGTQIDRACGIALDGRGNAVIVGNTYSSAWDGVSFNTGHQGNSDAFVVQIPDLTPGDANDDGAVDVGDLGILGTHYGTASGATWAMGDFTGDGAVDVGDLGVLGAHYGGLAAGSIEEAAPLAAEQLVTRSLLQEAATPLSELASDGDPTGPAASDGDEAAIRMDEPMIPVQPPVAGWQGTTMALDTFRTTARLNPTEAAVADPEVGVVDVLSLLELAEPLAV